MYRMKKQGNMIADLEMSGLHALLVDKDDPKYADDIKRQRGLNNKKILYRRKIPFESLEKVMSFNKWSRRNIPFTLLH